MPKVLPTAFATPFFWNMVMDSDIAVILSRHMNEGLAARVHTSSAGGEGEVPFPDSSLVVCPGLARLYKTSQRDADPEVGVTLL